MAKLRHIEELVNEQVRRSALARWQEKEMGEAVIHPVLTISRRMGTGARIVAGKVAERTGWSLWGKELLDIMATDANVSRNVVEAFDEKTVSEIELLVKSVLGEHEMGGFVYKIHLARAMAVIAKLGNAVILGRGGNFLVPDALKVRIDASDEFRILNVVRYEGVSRNEATKRVHASDQDRSKFLVHTFGKEQVNTFHYDLTLWMDNFSNDDAADIIIKAIEVRWKKRSS